MIMRVSNRNIITKITLANIGKYLGSHLGESHQDTVNSTRLISTVLYCEAIYERFKKQDQDP